MQIVEEAIIEGVTGGGAKSGRKDRGPGEWLNITWTSAPAFRVHIFVCNCGYLWYE